MHLQDVTVGGKAQGTVHGFADYGCFVKFYGDISGMIHVSELGLLPGKKASDAYAIGQVRPLSNQTQSCILLQRLQQHGYEEELIIRDCRARVLDISSYGAYSSFRTHKLKPQSTQRHHCALLYLHVHNSIS